MIPEFPAADTDDEFPVRSAGPDDLAVIYEIETAGKPGAVVGRHKVIVQSREMLSPEEVRAMKVGRSLVPAQYSNYDTTPLTVDVPGEGTVFDIQMAR